jgi:DNA-directed RNA polymerase I subunit RPA1
VCGPEAAILAFGLTDESSISEIENAWRRDQFSKDGDETLKRFDCVMSKKTNDCQDCIKKLIMPEKDEEMPGELLRIFPHNNLQMMFLSGGKGTQVNCVQISCTLGQISLEGRRPPLMLNGASLPSFLPYDVSPQAGGFASGRFLTGLRPQEYFFHCMAGREGLVDTAVKTSHSGYLQRCLIKHLEGITVAYDMTVRDSDGSVIQFLYGEDGVDVLKTSFIKCARSSDKFPQFPFIIGNGSVVVSREQLENIKANTNTQAASDAKHQIIKWKTRNRQKTCRSSPFVEFSRKKWSSVFQEISQTVDNVSVDKLHQLTKAELMNQWYQLSDIKKQSLMKKSRSCPDPVNSQLRSDRYFGSISEYLDELVDNYVALNPDNMLYEKLHCQVNKVENKRHIRSVICRKTTLQPMEAAEFHDLMFYKYQRSLVEPGEAVGLLAAQSIGEPSTQMTLNTFHFAGHQAMNVTLGIPRLREILMTASVDIKTPIMEVPVICTPKAQIEAERIAKKLTSVSLASVLKKLTVDCYLAEDQHLVNYRCRFYRVRFEFHKRKFYRDWSVLKPSAILAYIEKTFLSRLSYAIDRHIRETKNTTLLQSGRIISGRNTTANETDVDDMQNVAVEDDNKDNIDDDDNEIEDDGCDYDDDADDDKVAADDEELSESDADDNENEMCKPAIDSVSTDDEQQPAAAAVSLSRTDKHLPDCLRVTNVLGRVSNVSNYTYDVRHELWCEATFKYGLMNKSIDMTSVVEREINKAVLYQTVGIRRASAKKRKEDKEVMLRTEGLNIQEMYKYADVLDLNRLYTNNIHIMARHYGIEAAYRAIIQEVSSVFELYKITVDRRHLSLIADYMTFEGTFKPFNRLALETNTSPLQKMSFETTMHFLRNAILEASTDDLVSPSSRIATGRVMKSGTGYMDIITPVM